MSIFLSKASPGSRPMILPGLLLLFLLPAWPSAAQGEGANAGEERATGEEIKGWEIDHGASVFAVVTHKDGLAAKLAHNHLVTAQDVRAELQFAASAPESSSFEFEVDAAKLRIDLPADQERWYPRLEELGILDEAFAEIADDKRADIRESMLGRKQLKAKDHPKLGGKTRSIKLQGDGSYEVELELEILGETKVRPVIGSLTLKGGEADGGEIEELSLEASGAFEFTDFGIKPYSALLGAVKNSNTFHVYLHLVATPRR